MFTETASLEGEGVLSGDSKNDKTRMKVKTTYIFVFVHRMAYSIVAYLHVKPCSRTSIDMINCQNMIRWRDYNVLPIGMTYNIAAFFQGGLGCRLRNRISCHMISLDHNHETIILPETPSNKTGKIIITKGTNLSCI